MKDSQSTILIGDDQLYETITVDADTRADLGYKDNNQFTAPIVVSGSNKIFTPHHPLRIVASPSREKLEELIESTSIIDSSLRLEMVDSIENLSLQEITNDVLLLSHSTKQENGDLNCKLFYIRVPNQTTDSLPFKKFSQLLGIPYNFSKRNPDFLNRANFEYWQKSINVIQKNPKRLRMVYLMKPDSVTYHDENDIEHTLEAHNVVSIFEDQGSKANPSIENTVPLFSNILRNIKDNVETKLDANLALQSYSSGYNDTNNGFHFARLIFDHPDMQVRVGDDLFGLSITVNTNFTGTHKDFRSVDIAFNLFREVCSNGLTVTLSKQQLDTFKSVFIRMKLEGSQLNPESNEYKNLSRELEIRFKMITDSGIKIPIEHANASLNLSMFNDVMEYFLNSTEYYQKALQDLNQAFGEIVEKEFVEAFLNASVDLKIKNQEAMKYFCIEYIAGNMKGKQKFITPMDILNYLTLIARAYTTEVMMELETKAFQLCQIMATTFIAKQQAEKVSRYESYKSKVNSELL